jgi:hypothetical protein
MIICMPNKPYYYSSSCGVVLLDQCGLFVVEIQCGASSGGAIIIVGAAAMIGQHVIASRCHGLIGSIRVHLKFLREHIHR